MIFNNINEIKNDIKDKFIFYVNQHKDVSITYVFSLLLSYLRELYNLKELDDYSSYVENNEIFIRILKSGNVIDFKIDTLIETRKIKINKIKCINLFLRQLNNY